ncbi:hypothetical protein BCR34DRAFT_490418 [Clohesyomyces aquaticus]|uniref:Uncharacterized protein n=1 Tax=Clohesyomyces aquaticus TaxID=1231657 RepID=A0A1Y1Z732_9PLEO|nr:hypothetical protein BCR34DRAFT_490418 [Clohesyomyces aquaticus]
MHSPQDLAAEETPASTPFQSADDHSLSPTADANGDVDPLVVQLKIKIASAINDFKRELDRRDGILAEARGTIELALNTNFAPTYELTVVQHEDGAEYPITVVAKHKTQDPHAPVNKHSAAPPNTIAPLLAAASSSSNYIPTRRPSDAELEKDVVSRRKRRLEEGEDTSSKRQRTDEDEEDIMPLITKEDLDDLLLKLREDIQEDTSECVNHVHKLLRRFKEEWHEKSRWDYENMSARPTQGPFRDSIANGATSGSFPTPGADRDDSDASLPEVVRRETRLLSSQIRWVEECRRVATEVHDKREERWRETSATFHDQNRVDRETFQNRVLQENVMHGRMLNQILNEVKILSNYTSSLKWETPDHMSARPAYPPPPTVPAFPTQPAPPPRAKGSMSGPSKR